MAQFKQSTVPARSTTADRASPNHAALDSAALANDVVPAERSAMIPMLAVLMALLFAASAWFFYHQGQRDALGAASPPVSATNEAATHGSASLATNGSDPDSATPVAQTASNSEPDIIVTVHPKPEQMRAPAAKPKARLAKATKPAKSAPVVAKIDRQVVLATRPQPVYPAQALRTREQGTVLVLAQVDVNGHVSDARVVRRSGYSILDRAASNEVRRWTFSPALHDGQPIVASVQVPVSYRLDQ